MKKLLAFLLALICILSLCACGEKGSTYAATEDDISHLEKLYEGRTLYFGEAHSHADTGGNSDGQQPLSAWISQMDGLKLDFVTIVDHRQVSHMYLDEWDDVCFIGGSEVATNILDSSATRKNMHFNIIFSDPEAFKQTLRENGGFSYQEDTTFFTTPDYTTRQMKEIIASIKKNGGMFVHVHPKSPNYLTSDNAADYWFADDTGLEVFFGEKGFSVDQSVTKLNYQLWKDLLNLGTRVWATAGSDSHTQANNNALTAIYAEEKTPDSLFSHMRVGDFAPGFFGIRMTIGDAKMGSTGAFAGNRVVFSIGKCHERLLQERSEFQVVLLTDKGEVFREALDHTKENYYALDADPTANFYRVEVQDGDGNIVALGNPIWKAN